MKRLSTYIEHSNDLAINEGLFASLFGGLAKLFKGHFDTVKKAASAAWKEVDSKWGDEFNNLKDEESATKLFNTQIEEIPKKQSDEAKKNGLLASTCITYAGTANEKKWTKLADVVAKKTEELNKDAKFKEAYDAAVKNAENGGSGEGDGATEETVTNTIKKDAAAAKGMGADNKDAEAVRAALVTAFASPQGEGGATPATESLTDDEEVLLETKTVMDQFKKVFLDDKGQPVGDHLDALTNLLMALKVFSTKVSSGDLKKSISFLNTVLKDETIVNALQTGKVEGADDKSGGDSGSTSL